MTPNSNVSYRFSRLGRETFRPFIQQPDSDMVSRTAKNGRPTKWTKKTAAHSPSAKFNYFLLAYSYYVTNVGVRFVYHEYDYRLNWTTRSPIIN